jgi:uncharacterized protein (DUF58 family)
VGFLFLALAAAALGFGLLLKETALLVFALPILAVLSYTLLAAGVVFLASKRRARLLSAAFITHAETVSALLSGGGKAFFTPPAILVRYMVRLATKDGRALLHVFSKTFFEGKTETLPAGKRGAYFAPFDYLLISDIFGFFRFYLKIPAQNGVRLLLSPSLIGGRGATQKSGHGEHTAKYAPLPSDNLTEQRQYLPGDDPRRINWKLYGHSEELFVREAEKALSLVRGIIIICDTRTQKKDICAAADRICERGLHCARAAAASNAGSAAVTLYYRTPNGGGGEGEWTSLEWGGNCSTEEGDAKLRELFAYPYAIKADTAILPPPALPPEISEKDAVIVIADE